MTYKNKDFVSSTSSTAKNLGSHTKMIVGILLLVTGVGVVILQTYTWLRAGVWISYSVVDGAKLVWETQWLYSPTDWLGVHSFLSKFPLSLLMIGVGFTLFIDAADEL